MKNHVEIYGPELLREGLLFITRFGVMRTLNPETLNVSYFGTLLDFRFQGPWVSASIRRPSNHKWSFKLQPRSLKPGDIRQGLYRTLGYMGVSENSLSQPAIAIDTTGILRTTMITALVHHRKSLGQRNSRFPMLVFVYHQGYDGKCC